MMLALRGLVVFVLLAAGAAAPSAHGNSRPETRVAVLPAGEAPVSSPFPMSHVGLRWQGDEDAVVEVRTGLPGRLGPWRSVPVAHDLSDEDARLHLSGLLRADGTRLVQARARGAVHNLEIVAIDAVSGFPTRPPKAVPVAQAAPAAGATPPEVITRAGWGADERMRRGTPEFAGLSKLFVHHTVTPNDDPDPSSTVRAIYAFHTRSRGWADIGYNFLIDASGRVYEGRYARDYAPGETPTGEDTANRGVVGAHARGFNAGSVGVALLGDFSGGAQPTPAAVEGLVGLLAWKAQRHGIDPHGADPYRGSGGTHTFPNLAGHRDTGQTACPGGRLYERLPEIRDRVAQAMHPAAPPAPLVPPLPLPPGFWTATADGRVRAYGDAAAAGDLAGHPLAAPVVSMAATPGGDGYWLAGADGGVFAFGKAPFLGSAAGALSSPAVHLEPAPSGRGYWVVSAGGEVAPFGDAVFWGATAPLPVEIAGMAATPTGRGYWMAAADGRVFSFGDALLHRAAGAGTVAGTGAAVRPAAPIVAIAAHPGGRGYWLLGADGGVFAFGVPFHGSVPGRGTRAGAVELRVTESGEGYYVAGHDGSVFAFGDADRRRERQGDPGEEGVVDFALRVQGPRPPGASPPAELASPGPPPVPGRL